jgi:hypothetical protein
MVQRRFAAYLIDSGTISKTILKLMTGRWKSASTACEEA